MGDIRECAFRPCVQTIAQSKAVRSNVDNARTHVLGGRGERQKRKNRGGPKGSPYTYGPKGSAYAGCQTSRSSLISLARVAHFEWAAEIKGAPKTGSAAGSEAARRSRRSFTFRMWLPRGSFLETVPFLSTVAGKWTSTSLFRLRKKQKPRAKPLYAHMSVFSSATIS